MEQFDPKIPGLIEGTLTGVAVIDPQPFVGGVGNRVIDPTKSFTVAVEWELHGQLAPLWLTALNGNWDVSVYAESLGAGPEIRLASASVATTATLPCTVNQAQVNCSKFRAELVVAPNTLVEHTPGTDNSGIYKLAVAVFLNSGVAGIPGYDLIGFAEGPLVQAENPQ
ncbi:MAG: hypothetical protein ACT4RN_05970 [Pseudonocardia sp.]